MEGREYTFFLNWMGPVSLRWYEKNKIPFSEETRYSKILNKEITIREYNPRYCCGRIDISPDEENPYGFEIGVSVMEEESWGKLGLWLRDLRLGRVPTGSELFSMYERQTGDKIKWFKE